MYLTRCCCCIPLRHGLLTWGYIKLILLAVSIGTILHEEVIQKYHKSTADYAASISTVVLNVIDVVFTIILIIAGHTKKATLFKVYYWYSITYLLLTACLLIGWIVGRDHEDNPDFLKDFVDMLFGTVFTVVYMVTTIYIILLLRSEIRKLDGESYPNVQFTKPGRPYYNVQHNDDA